MKNTARRKRDRQIYALHQGAPRLSYTQLARLFGLSERQVGTIVRSLQKQQEAKG